MKVWRPVCGSSPTRTTPSVTLPNLIGKSSVKAVTARHRQIDAWNRTPVMERHALERLETVLGMPANRDWVFLANYSDKSLLRNALGMKISSILKMDWTPRYRIVELWINGEYQGVYNVFEKKEVTKNKVNIDLAAGDCYLWRDPQSGTAEALFSVLSRDRQARSSSDPDS